MWLRIAWAVVRRPRLWPTAVRQVRRLAPTGWWRRRPFLPVPSPAYVAFRAVTQHGGDPPSGTARSAAATMTADDVVDYLRWCRLGARS